MKINNKIATNTRVLLYRTTAVVIARRGVGETFLGADALHLL